MRYHSLAPILLLSLSGCMLPEDDWGVVKTVWNDFPWWSVVWRLAVGAMLGVVIGVVVGLSVSALLNRWGAYRLPWPRLRLWLRTLVVASNLGLMPMLFGAIGFCQALYHAGDFALRHSRIGKEWLPSIAEAGADAICCVDCFIADDKMPDWDDVGKKRQPVDVPRLLAHLDTFKGGVAEKLVARAKERIFEEHPDWQDSAAETVLDWTLPLLVDYLQHREVQSRLAALGITDVRAEMLAAARQDGDDFLTHAEMTDFLTERLLIPIVLAPLQHWVRSVQGSAFTIVIAWFAAPVLLMWLTRNIVFWRQRRALRRLCLDKI